MPKAKPNKIYTLIEQGLEDESIELLKKYNTSEVEALQNQRSIWHLAVRNNLQSLVEYLALEYPKNIDCLGDENLTPWALAVTENNAAIARFLEARGANTGIYLNEEGQTLLHKAAAESDIALLNQCIECHVPGNIVDSKGFTASYYARMNKNETVLQLLKKLRFANFVDGTDLNNAVIKNHSEALQQLLKDGVDPKKISSPTLLDLALIYNSNKVLTILHEAGVGRRKSDDEIREIRRQKFGKKPNPLVAIYAMEKLSLKKSEFKISVMLLMAISIAAALITALIASSLILAIGAGIISGLLYTACVGKMHFSKVNKEKELKSDYKKTLDQKRAEVLKLAEQINTEKNAELLDKLANEFKEAPKPTFTTTDAGCLKISGGKLLLIDKQIESLKKGEIEVPESARTHNRAKI